MIKKVVFTSLLIILSAFGLAESVSAHSLVNDDNTGIGASFHVTPNHEPIAGENSIISFDFSETSIKVADYSLSLTVSLSDGESVTVPITVDSNVVFADYTFPVRGLYDITLVATSKADGTLSTLKYSQRVSHGVSIATGKNLGIAEIALVIGVVGVAIGAVIFSLKSNHK